MTIRQNTGSYDPLYFSFGTPVLDDDFVSGALNVENWIAGNTVSHFLPFTIMSSSTTTPNFQGLQWIKNDITSSTYQNFATFQTYLDDDFVSGSIETEVSCSTATTAINVEFVFDGNNGSSTKNLTFNQSDNGTTKRLDFDLESIGRGNRATIEVWGQRITGITGSIVSVRGVYLPISSSFNEHF